MYIYHCDREGCDHTYHVDLDLPCPFLTVTNHEGTELAHCCSLECLMHWAANQSS